MKRLVFDALDSIVRSRGYGIYIPSQLGLEYGVEILKRTLEFAAIDMVFDIGANAGQYATSLRKAVKYRGPIVCVEPIPELGERIRQLNDPLVEVHSFALGDTPQTTDFNIMAGDQFSSLRKPAQAYDGKFFGQHSIARTIQVKVETFAALYEQTRRRHAFKNLLLKIDTQGTELDVLKGAGPLVTEIPVVQMEISFDPIYEGAPHFSETITTMEQQGYVLSGMFPNNDSSKVLRLLEMDAVFLRRERFPQLS